MGCYEHKKSPWTAKYCSRYRERQFWLHLSVEVEPFTLQILPLEKVGWIASWAVSLGSDIPCECGWVQGGSGSPQILSGGLGIYTGYINPSGYGGRLVRPHKGWKAVSTASLCSDIPWEWGWVQGSSGWPLKLKVEVPKHRKFYVQYLNQSGFGAMLVRHRKGWKAVSTASLCSDILWEWGWVQGRSGWPLKLKVEVPKHRKINGWYLNPSHPWGAGTQTKTFLRLIRSTWNLQNRCIASWCAFLPIWTTWIKLLDS